MRGMCLIAAVMITAGTVSVASAGEIKGLKTSEKSDIGHYLVTSDGMSVYLFEKDRPGTSKCYDQCAQVWPPVTAAKLPSVAGSIDPEKLGLSPRKDGKKQVTYNGWPLYTYAPDTSPGDIKGQDIEGFGAEWYLIRPSGEKAGHHHEDHDEAGEEH